MMKTQRLNKNWKILAAAIICTALITGSILLWQRGNVAEAAMIEPIHEGLVGWWRFDEGTGNTAKDSSGNGNDATIHDATWVDGKYGKALSFDGADDYVTVSDSSSLDITNEVSVSAWVKTFTQNPDIYPSYVIAVKMASSSPWYCYGLRIASNKIAGMVMIDGTVRYVFSDHTLEYYIDDWHHLAVTYDGNALKLYIDGVQQTDIWSGTGTIGTSDDDFRIGAWNPNNYYGESFTGLIDEVRVYNKALSAVEIQDIFRKSPDFSPKMLAKVPEGTTQVIVTVSWQGTGDMNVVIETPSETYAEENVTGIYQKSMYSTTEGMSGMLNVKRLSVSVNALSSDEDWYIELTFDNVEDYRMTVEIQR